MEIVTESQVFNSYFISPFVSYVSCRLKSCRGELSKLSCQSKEFHHLLGGLGIGVAVLDKAVSPDLARQAHQELEVMADKGKLSEFSQSFLDKIGSNFFFLCVWV